MKKSAYSLPKIRVPRCKSYEAIGRASAKAIHGYRYDFEKYFGYTPNPDDMPPRIGMWLDLNNMTPRELGSKCKQVGTLRGIKFDEPSVYKYLYGVCKPKADRLRVMAHVMGVTIEWLTGCVPIDHPEMGFKPFEHPAFVD